MSTYNYPEIANYFGKKVKLDWAADTVSDDTIFPRWSTPALLTAIQDADDPNLVHVVRATAPSKRLVMGNGDSAAAVMNQLVLGNGEGVSGFIRKLNPGTILFSSTSSGLTANFVPHFEPEGFSKAIILMPGWFTDSVVVEFFQHPNTPREFHTENIRLRNFIIAWNDAKDEPCLEFVQFSCKLGLKFTDGSCTLTVSNIQWLHSPLLVQADGTIDVESRIGSSSDPLGVYDYKDVLGSAEIYVLTY